MIGVEWPAIVDIANDSRVRSEKNTAYIEISYEQLNIVNLFSDFGSNIDFSIGLSTITSERRPMQMA
ncbi:hypothetical protein X798_08158 [Onchocerca flexuosa]|uniref:Uncharacterized protein n=1 Tax=Onchocerca flexuosa TaxID=387005 RepID=A0A238BJ20_9BILA|nr:hypothetical protein X798_08158 [Onchocerca flexuosa]